jgi:hypothetical protein
MVGALILPAIEYGRVLSCHGVTMCLYCAWVLGDNHDSPWIHSYPDPVKT